jgi:hypothetical protein
MSRLRLFLLLSLASACGSSGTAPPENLVIGQWGGPGLGLTADRNSVHAQFQCDAADFHAPLVPGQNGEFVLPGTVSMRSAQVQLGARGVSSGATITLEVIRWFPGGSNVQQFVVTRDRPADLSGACTT